MLQQKQEKRISESVACSIYAMLTNLLVVFFLSLFLSNECVQLIHVMRTSFAVAMVYVWKSSFYAITFAIAVMEPTSYTVTITMLALIIKSLVKISLIQNVTKWTKQTKKIVETKKIACKIEKSEQNLGFLQKRWFSLEFQKYSNIFFPTI